MPLSTLCDVVAWLYTVHVKKEPLGVSPWLELNEFTESKSIQEA